MTAQKKRAKAYKPGRLAGENIKLKLQPWKVAALMNPLTSILDQLEQEGTIDVTGQKGVAVFRDHNDGHWYESSVAIAGVVEAFEIHEIRFGLDLHLDGLRKLGKALEYGMPVDAHQTAAARDSLKHIRAATLEMSAGYARDLIQDFQIKEALGQAREAV
ncbi:hypothetical protein EJD96_00170 (plasmid) [Herbaspirillum seropedicae]|uniref:hypothetical protein n=1 Tax=Herbaspirillum seropedicae TaxID=964 RepID=UPI0011243684|nr:hypothetical protein [Herbaspirillum seropedicae]QDD62666.1 hypothetical protein EJD96_00170 [Herbaspirillum seropedicae]